MYRISNEQIDYMLHQITNQGISDEGLRDSILDHVCCLIENSKEPIADFEICFQSYLKKFYQNKLEEIEVETHLLITFKHYYQMKKFMLLLKQTHTYRLFYEKKLQELDLVIVLRLKIKLHVFLVKHHIKFL